MNSFLHVSISHSSKASSKAWEFLIRGEFKTNSPQPTKPLTPFKWSERFKVNPSLFKPWNCSRPSNDVLDKDVFDSL